MNILALVHLLVFVCDIALIVIVLSKSLKARLNRLCILVSISFAIWSLSYCFTHQATTAESALFWINISSIGWVAFPAAGLYFYLALVGSGRVIHNKFLALACGFLVVFFLYEQWSGNLVSSVIEKTYGWAGVWSMSVYSYLLFAYFFAAAIGYFYLIFRYRRRVKTNREKAQARVLLITAIIGYSLGFITDILLPILHITVLPQLADIFVSIWGVGIVICITRYGLMSVSPITAAEQILDTMTDALFLLEPDGKIKRTNQATLELLEFKAGGLVDTSFNSIAFSKESGERFLKKTMRRGKSFNEELIFITNSGKHVPVFVSASVIHDQTKTAIGYVVLARDMTEHKRLEESIRHQAGLIQSISDAIVSRTNDYKIVSWNKSAETMFGWSEEEVIGKSLLEVLKTDFQDYTLEEIEAAMVKTGHGSVESIHQCKDGTKINTLDSISYTRDEQGKNIGAVIVFKDITERRRTQEALRASEENIRLQKELIERVLATIPNAVFLLDNDLRVTMTNQAAMNILKLDKRKSGGLVGKTLEIGELNGTIRNMVKRRQNTARLEFRHIVAEHERILIAEIFTMPKDELLVVINDVTEEREKQERLYLTDRLASVGEMASGVAHELNNPLTSIIGLSSLLLQKSTMDNPDELQEDLEAIHSEAQRCAVVVKNLLTFARRHAPTRQPVNVAKIMEDVIKLRSYEHKANNITVKMDFSPGMPEVLADYFQMQQVFLNIILNAEAAMIDAHGQGTLKIIGEKAGNYLRVSFTDDGPGITKENLRLIFNPFFTTKDVGKGTGLGLSICYGIVTAHKGKIYAESEYGRGATFVVELPVNGHPLG